MPEIKKTNRRSPSPTPTRVQATAVSNSIRDRALDAAFSLFRENGFSSTSMLDIVTKARISKRDLYALFDNKHAVLAACISEHTEQMRRTLDITAPVPQTRGALTKLLVEFGVSILKTVCHTHGQIEATARNTQEGLMEFDHSRLCNGPNPENGCSPNLNKPNSRGH